MRVLGYAAAARRRRAREYSFSCTPGWRPGVSRAALLHRRLQLSSAQPRAANLRTTAMLDTPLTHGCVHRTERVQQQPSATIIRCVQWMQRSRNHSQSLWRPACLPYSTHNQKPWVQHPCLFYKPWFVYGVQYCTPYKNHGLYKGCQLHPCFTNHGLYNPKPWVPSSAGRVQETERMIHRPKTAVEASWMQAGCARGPHGDKLVRTTGASAPKQLPTSRA